MTNQSYDGISRESIESRIIAFGFKHESGESWRGKCPNPGHGGDGTGESCVVTIKQDGPVAHCFVGGPNAMGTCTSADILTALGVVHTARQDRTPCTVPGCGSDSSSLIAVYDGVDGRKRGAHRIECYAGHSWKGEPCDPDSTKHVWSCKAGDMPKECYVKLWGEDSPEDVVVVVEGEKAAARLLDIEGYTPASWPGGASAAAKHIYTPLANRTVILWPDNDGGGFKAMDAVYRKIQGFAAEVKGIPLDRVASLPKGGDAADCTTEMIAEFLAAAGAYTKADARSKEASTPEARGQFDEFLDGELDQPAFARRFLQFRPENLGVAYDERDRGVLFYIGWNGVWRQSETSLRRLYTESVDTFEERAAAAMLYANPDGWKAARSAIREARRQSVYKQTVSWVESEAKKLKDDGGLNGLSILEDVRLLDSDLRFIGAVNGVVDLDTGRILTGEEAKAKHVSMTIPDAYDPDAVHPDVERLTEGERWDETREWFWGSAGWAARGEPDRRLNLARGKEGGEGKTTITRAFSAAFGEYASNPHHDSLVERRGGANMLSPEMEAFVDGVRFAFVNERVRMRVSMERLKLISGGGNIEWRGMYGNRKRSMLTATLFLFVNSLPRVDLTDLAFKDRLRIIDVHRPDDVVIGLGRRLETDMTARQALVAKVVRYAVAFKDGPPDDVPGMEDMLAEMESESNPEFAWIDERLSFTNQRGDVVHTARVYEEAQKSTGEEKPWGLEKRTFTARVRDRLGLPGSVKVQNVSIGGKSKPGWRGVRLRTAAEASIEEPAEACTRGQQHNFPGAEECEGGRWHWPVKLEREPCCQSGRTVRGLTDERPAALRDGDPYVCYPCRTNPQPNCGDCAAGRQWIATRGQISEWSRN